MSKVRLAVCTIEKANSIVNRLLQAGTEDQISMVVVDEIHMIGDTSRGWTLETMLTKLRYIQQKRAAATAAVIAGTAAAAAEGAAAAVARRVPPLSSQQSSRPPQPAPQQPAPPATPREGQVGLRLAPKAHSCAKVVHAYYLFAGFDI